jgi:TRAP-type mannitol/chloroaromatic compound transport system permease large subunit
MESAADWPPLITRVPRKPKVAQFCAAPWPNFTPPLTAEFVKSLDLTPIQFLIIAQLIIFLLGWPLEWSEIIIIFVPIFLPLLPLFEIDPLFFGVLVALNLQTSFLTPPMAMSAYYLKGIAPPNIKLTEIFSGVLPYCGMVLIAMVIMYNFPQIVFGLPDMFYGPSR